MQRGEAEEERAPQHAGGEDSFLPARGHVSVFDRSCSLLFYASLQELRGNIRVHCRVRPVLPFDHTQTSLSGSG